MKRKIINVLCLFVPVKSWRKSLRNCYKKDLLDNPQNDINAEIQDIKRSLNIMFKYMTNGLELYPYKNQMERILTADFRDAKPNHLARYAFARDLLKETDNVLDIACSIGYGSDCIKRKAAKVTGVDFYEPAIDYANKVFARSGTEFICESATNANLFKPETFDAVVSFETVEHIEGDNTVLSNFNKWLKPNGKLIFSVPNQEKMPFDPSVHIYHVKHYTESEVKELLEKNGFKIEKMYKQDYGHIAELSDDSVTGIQWIVEAIKA